MNGTATRRTRAPYVTNAEPAHERAPEMWLPGTKYLSRPAKSARNQYGLVRQAAYVAIDFALVCAGGAIAFWLRFDLANPFSRIDHSPGKPLAAGIVRQLSRLFASLCRARGSWLA